MPLVFRDTKGSDLTASEVDGNFRNVDGRLTLLETTPIVPVGIDFITSINGSFSIHLTNGNVEGPFQIPFASLEPRGTWAPEVEYNRLDYFNHAGIGYVVLIAHESPLVFDPAFEVLGEPALAIAVPPVDQIYDIGFYNQGRVPGGEVIIFRQAIVRPIHFLISQIDSKAILGTPFANAWSPPPRFSLKRLAAGDTIPTEFGFIEFAQADPISTFVTITVDTQFSVGDSLLVASPPGLDPVAADLSVTLVAIVG